MATVTASALRSPSLLSQSIHSRFPNSTTSPAGLLFRKCPEGKSQGSSSASWKLNAFPDWPLMAVMVEHVANQRDYVVHKSIWHLSDATMKNVYTMYIMFTVWGCCFFGSTKDPFYDSEGYRKDGGDGSVHWIYEKQEDIEESARAELWREELIEEIEQKVGGLRELEEARKEEELVK
ncbi:photosynthetic NDH subunit of subcomplex B 4, chloroplastic-like isoform X1 [Zingiber officinale]|uniref:Photosynthetic NDH subcomplex B 4 n=1 Tax=Zingiber officinale TaxID=94328 RepID=A0A8J5LQ94_ZINOF|nr:photosynthetic NDH subunit of subcomplex B 4, chloroplastic-like isoform X1 [Zingiber officinale]XP_042466801.1 photosynthetic NDH subunit of subcomplex B 4, chloroplastic-like isoform X1 [Zingiber officinale]KAG6529505.1 hypothetical protein ZIOFF_011704 [Zingiber officinale]